MTWASPLLIFSEISYQEEIREIFKRHRVAFEERYVWDGSPPKVGRTPFQGGSLYFTYPGLKRPTSQSDSTELAEVLRRGWLFGVT
jgi:hypothetical protein